MTDETFVPLTKYQRLLESEMKRRATENLQEAGRRRTVREFSSETVDRTIIEECLKTASTAPSGANQQPWKFVVVSDLAVKQEIRRKAEEIEEEFYTKAATKKWREALEHLNTGPTKEFLDTAPYLVVIFAESYSLSSDGEKIKNYYVKESVGIATGMLISALHNTGLASLTYTPVNMSFLNDILRRPTNEKAFMILVVGYPAQNVLVPDLQKKRLEEFTVFV